MDASMITSRTFAALVDALAAVDAAQWVTTDNPLGVPMRIVDVERVDGAVECVVVTADGLPADLWPHEGTETGEGVYSEAWRPWGCTWRGWVDPTSRRIVQTFV